MGTRVLTRVGPAHGVDKRVRVPPARAFQWNPKLQPWTLSSTQLATGRGGLPQGAAAYLAAVPKGDPTAMLPWKVYEDGRSYVEGSTACALYHCVADNIIAAGQVQTIQWTLALTLAAATMRGRGPG